MTALTKVFDEKAITQIEFPKLGIELDINRIAFNLFGLEITWYGIIISIGVLLAMLYCFSQTKDYGLDGDRTIDVVIAGFVGGIIGARAYYVIMQWEQYKDNLAEIVNLRQGGLAFYGSLIGGVLAGGLVAKFRKVKFLPLMDLASQCFLIGQGIGRWGNFVNQEAFGNNTNLPWGMTGGRIRNILLAQAETGLNPDLPVHPCFLYESVWCLLGVVVLRFLAKRRKFDGQIMLMYIVWYGVGRFFIESLRTDSLMIGTFRTSQLLAAVSALTAVTLLIVLGKKAVTDGAVLYCNTEEAKALLAKKETKPANQTTKEAKEADESPVTEIVSEEKASENTSQFETVSDTVKESDAINAPMLNAIIDTLKETVQEESETVQEDTNASVTIAPEPPESPESQCTKDKKGEDENG